MTAAAEAVHHRLIGSHQIAMTTTSRTTAGMPRLLNRRMPITDPT